MVLNPGDKIKVSTKINRGWKTKDYEVVNVSEKFITVKTDYYKETILKVDLVTGRVKIELIKNEGDIENMKKEPKISKEQFIAECREHGLGREAIQYISQKYGLAEVTVRNYIQLYLSKDEREELREMKKEAAAQEAAVTEIKEEIEQEVREEPQPEQKIAEIVKPRPDLEPINESSSPDEIKAELEEPTILTVTCQGKNGQYILDENGVVLVKDGARLAFGNREELKGFYTEFNKIFGIWGLNYVKQE